MTHLLLYLLSNEAVIFKVYDIDGKGRVTFKDLIEVLRDLTGSFMSEEQRKVLTFSVVALTCGVRYNLIYEKKTAT
jgi:hypothetical protein